MDDDGARTPAAIARRAIGLIDLTDLADDRSVDGIDELCRRAVEHGTAAVCVWPDHVARCAARLAGTPIRIATVVNFPSGDEPIADVVSQTRTALSAGAHEIDVVMPYRRFLADDLASVTSLLDAVRSAVAQDLLKVILETGELSDLDQIRGAARLAIDHGADFVKTSTGKTPVGATREAVGAMLDVVAEARSRGAIAGVKPSGGIRTLDDVAGCLTLADEIMGDTWASPSTFRFGASGLLDVLLDVIQAGER